MEAYKDLNSHSDKWLAEIEKFRPKGDEHVKFRMLSGQLNPDPTAREKEKIIYPQSEKIPGVDKVKDPYGKTINIGLVQTFHPVTGMPEFRSRIVYSRQSGGHFFLYGDNQNDMEDFVFLMSSNYNASNPFRNTNVTPLYELVDDKAVAKKLWNSTILELNATTLLSDMDLTTKKTMAISYGISEEQDEDLLTIALHGLVKGDAKKFIDIFNNKDGLEINGVLGRALTKGIIGYLPEERKYVHLPSGDAFATVGLVEGKKPLQLLAEWVTTSPKGYEVYDTIKSLLNPKVDGRKKGANKTEPTE